MANRLSPEAKRRVVNGAGTWLPRFDAKRARGIEASGRGAQCAGRSCGSLQPCPQPKSNSLAVTLRHLAETLAFAAAGGLTLGLIGMPAGFLSGSILAVAAASLAGRPMLIPIAADARPRGADRHVAWRSW